jgi:hypothetical protein
MLPWILGEDVRERAAPTTLFANDVAKTEKRGSPWYTYQMSATKHQHTDNHRDIISSTLKPRNDDQSESSS